MVQSMKIILAIFLALFSVNLHADEPSVKRECQSGFKSYYLGDNSRIDTCPNVSGALKLDVISRGKNNHSCWWPVNAKLTGSGYSATEGDCELTMSNSGTGFDVIFNGECRYYCGANARFVGGFFDQRPSN